MTEHRDNIKRLAKRLLKKDLPQIAALTSIEKEELKMRILFKLKQQVQ